MPPPPKALAQRPAVTTVLALAAPVTTKDRPVLPPVSNAAMSALLGKPGPPPPAPAPGRIPPGGQDLVGNGAVAAAQHAEPAPVEAAPAATARPGPQADPKFATLKKDVQRKKRTVAASHPPPKAEAGAAQGAARPPKDDVEARGKTVNADKMNESKPKEFDKAAFIRAVEQAIADKAPKNLDQAEKFADSGKPAEIKAEVQGRVGEGKADSASEIATTTAAPPDTSAVEPKKVVPLAADRPPGAPATPDPANAVPDTLPPSATDLSAGPAEINQQMAGADVTETQLKKSNEPTFTHALAEKKVAEQDSAAAPGRMRAHEAQELQTSTARAKRLGATSMAAMAARRVNTGQKVATGKTGAKSRDEEKRVQVTAILQGVFDTMKADVEAILSGLDKKVDDQFTSGEKKARDEFTAEHKHKIEEYKDQRYGPWWNPAGKGRWLRDLFKGLPPEVNAIYDDARKTYVTKLKTVIADVADTIGNELNRAKSRIAQGRNELQTAVKQLPADLQAIGKNAAAEFTDKFAELTQIVDDKGTELVDTLATKYTAALKSVDDEIAEEKENNKGLIDKAKDLINGVIQLIRELEKLIETVLAKAREAGRLIMRDPIGFLKNLISAVGDGLRLFMRNIRTHLLQGVMTWLLGKATEAGLQLPDKFDVRGVVTMLAGLLGLTPQAIWARITRKLPPQVAAVAEEVTATAVPLVAEVRKRGVGAMWDDLKTRVGDLRQTLLDKVIAYVTPEIVWAGISWILSMLNPATAFVRAVKLIIDIVCFIVTQARQIIDFVNAVLDAIIAIARGGTGGVPGMIERALAKAIPILLGFLAALLGLGGIAGKVKKIIQAITKPVGDAIDWVIDKVVGLLKAGWTKLRLKLGPKKAKPADSQHETADQHTRSKSQQNRDLAAAVTEADSLFDHGLTEQQISAKLPPIETRYRLTSLRLVVDQVIGDEKVVHVEGVVNPVRRGRRRRIGAAIKKLWDKIRGKKDDGKPAEKKADPAVELKLPGRVGLRPSGRNQYTYEAGHTQALLDSLRALGASTTEGKDGAGRHTITAVLNGRPRLRFAERSTPADLQARLAHLAEIIERRGASREERGEVIGQLRTPTARPQGELEGHVLDTALAENQRAIASLIQQLSADNPDVIVGMERGGAFLADVLAAGSPALAAKARRIPVFRAPRTGSDKFQESPMQAQFEQFIAEGARRIAVVDVYMGGRTASSLRDQIFLPLARRHPGVHFEVHWIREVMGFERQSAHGIIVDPTRGVPRATQPGAGQVRSTAINVRMALGDDMDIVFDTASRAPITIFDRQGRIVRVLYPSSGQATRHLLIALLNQPPADR